MPVPVQKLAVVFCAAAAMVPLTKLVARVLSQISSSRSQQRKQSQTRLWSCRQPRATSSLSTVRAGGERTAPCCVQVRRTAFAAGLCVHLGAGDDLSTWKVKRVTITVDPPLLGERQPPYMWLPHACILTHTTQWAAFG